MEQLDLAFGLLALKKKLLGALVFLGVVLVPAAFCGPQP